MIEAEITTENFEKDSLKTFEKLLQGYNKAKEALAWESNLENLIKKMTHLPTAPFPRQLMKLFDYHYIVLGEDIVTLINNALRIREQMQHKQRFVRIKEEYYSLPFLPKNTYLKRLNVYNHEGELCYYLQGKLYIRLRRLLIWLSPRRQKIAFHDLIAVKQTMVRLQNLEIYYYSPFLDLSTTNPVCYYDFFSDYYGKGQFLKYFNTKSNTPQPLKITLHNSQQALGKVLRLSSSQQVLWAYFLFRLIGLKLRVNVEVAIITRFLLVVNNVSLEDYKKSYFYKLVSKAPFVKEDKRLITDLEVVRLHFMTSKLPTGDIEKEILNLITK